MNKVSMAALLLVALSISPAFCVGVSVVGDMTKQAVVSPGGKVEGTIRVRNSMSTTETVRAYQTDYLFQADGSNMYGEPGSVARSNAAWVTIYPRQFEVPGNSEADISYTVQVPPDEALVGTYWSLVMVERVPKDVLEPPKGDKPTVSIRSVMRFAIQMVTDIDDTGKRAIKFSDETLGEKDGKRLFEFTLENTGERWLRPIIWAELFGEDGQSSGRINADAMRLYPGCTGRFGVNLTGVAAGKYRALIVVDNKDETVFGKQYELLIP